MLYFCRNFFIYLCVILAFGCSHKPAKIIDRGDFFYNKANSYKYSKSYKSYSEIEDGYIKVVPGDTVNGIANFYGISASDIISENNLRPPYMLKVGQKLKVPNNFYHKVASGDTLFKISKLYNVKFETLVKNNNLSKPYNIYPNQVLIVANKDIIKNSKNDNLKVTKSDSLNIDKSADSKEVIKSSKIASKSDKSVNLATNQSNKAKSVRLIKKDNEFSWPVSGKVVSTYGPKKGGLHNDGINIKAKKGSSVMASEDGVVAYVGNELRGYGNLIIIKHSEGWITAYAHLNKAFVSKGDEVSKGQKIAEVGSTGNVSFDQLYFGLRKGRDAVDPTKYLK